MLKKIKKNLKKVRNIKTNKIKTPMLVLKYNYMTY